VFGPRSADEAIANLEQFATEIDPKLWRALKRDELIHAAAPTP
jgi:hypothetical protein